MHAGQAGAWHVPWMRIAGECIVWLRSRPAVLEGAETRLSAPTSALDRCSYWLYPEEQFKPRTARIEAEVFDDFQS
jgi:hypothetical protein